VRRHQKPLDIIQLGLSPSEPEGPLSPCRIDLFLILTITLLTDLPYYVLNFLPRHDLLQIFSYQNYLYSGLLYNDSVPQWIPFIHWGARTETMQVAISPFSSAFGLLGYLADEHNSVRLLFMAITAEKVFFAVSLYFLSLSLYGTRTVCVLVPSLAAATVFWFWGPAFNLFQVSLVPLALLLILRFVGTSAWPYLWLSGCVLSVCQGFPVFAPVLALCLAAVLVALLLQHPNQRAFFSRPSLRAIGLFALCAGLVGLHALLLKRSFDDLSLFVPARAHSAAITLSDFLSYGVSKGIDTPAQAVILGYLDTARWTAYLGLLPLVCALVGVVTAVRPVARALAVGCLVLALLIAAGGGAAVMFQFPAMGYFRHLQHIFPLLKVFLILMAGLVFDRVLIWLHRSDGLSGVLASVSFWPVVLGAGLLLVTVDGVAAPILRALLASGAEPLLTWSGSPADGARLAVTLSYLRVCLYAFVGVLAVVVARRHAWPKHRRASLLAGLLILGIVADIASYHWQAYHQWTWEVTYNPRLLDTLRAYRPTLPDQRERVPEDAMQVDVLSVVSGTAPGVKSADYALFDVLVQFDRCLPAARTHAMATGPAHLVQVRGGTFVPGVLGSILPWEDRALMTVLGCETKKFRLVADAVLAASEEERDRWLKETAAIDRTVILGPVPPGKPKPDIDAKPKQTVAGEISVAAYQANRIALTVHNPAPYPVWLVYADAYVTGWQATVNGHAVPTYRAYGAFKAVSVPPGDSRVVWRYAPRWSGAALPFMRLVPGLLLLGLLVAMILLPRPLWYRLRPTGTGTGTGDGGGIGVNLRPPRPSVSTSAGSV